MMFYIESNNGHDEINVPDDQVAAKVDEQLDAGKWVTVEKQDGSSEILTNKEEAKTVDWASVFSKKTTPTPTAAVSDDEAAVKDVLSSEEKKPEPKVTCTAKMKGG